MNPPPCFVFRTIWNHVISLCFVELLSATIKKFCSRLAIDRVISFPIHQVVSTIQYRFVRSRRLPDHARSYRGPRQARFWLAGVARRLLRSGLANLLLQLLAHITDALLL